MKLEEVTLARQVEADEILVRMVATGVCHTDILYAMAPAEALGPYPKVLGHEGAGYVEEVGSNVKAIKRGDAVLCSFSSCSSCTDCKTGHPSFCRSFAALNFVSAPELYSKSSGLFFGQSSFSNLCIVRESSVVNVTSLIESKEDLHLFAPLGCGFQTGAGTVENFCNAGPSDAIVIIGLGGVGLSSIMAAKIAGAHTIIGIDRIDARLQLAKSMGATHVINTAEGETPLEKVTDVVKEMTNGDGASIAIDTAGVVPLIKSALDFIGNRGQLVLVGVPPLDTELGVHLVSFLQTGKILRGCIEGDATPSTYVPKMIKWFRDGKLPIDQLIKTYPVAEYAKAIEDMHSGKTIKPVLLW